MQSPDEVYSTERSGQDCLHVFLPNVLPGPPAGSYRPAGRPRGRILLTQDFSFAREQIHVGNILNRTSEPMILGTIQLGYLSALSYWMIFFFMYSKCIPNGIRVISMPLSIVSGRIRKSGTSQSDSKSYDADYWYSRLSTIFLQNWLNDFAIPLRN